MNKIVIDREMRSKLGDLKEPVELCDESWLNADAALRSAITAVANTIDIEHAQQRAFPTEQHRQSTRDVWP